MDPAGPTREEDLELYDLSVDPAELNDLSEAEPERRAAMIELCRQQKEALGIRLWSEVADLR